MPEIQFELPVAPPPPVPERRDIRGWFLLGALFFLLIAGALILNFKRDKKSESVAILAGEQIYTLACQNRSEIFKPLVKESATSGQAIWDSLNRGDRSSIVISELRVQLAYETGRKMDPADLKALGKQSGGNAFLMHQLYTKKVDPKTAKTIFDGLSGPNYKVGAAKLRAAELAGMKQWVQNSVERSTFKMMGFVIAFLAALVVGFIVWLFFMIKRSKGDWAPVGFPIGPISAFEADSLAFRFFYILLVLMLPLPIPDIMGKGTGEVVETTVKLALAFAIIAIPILGKKLPLSKLFGRRIPIWKVPVVGLLGNFGTVPPMFCALLLLAAVQKYLPDASHPGATELMKNPTLFNIILFGFQAAIMAPVLEEILFRGMLAPALARLRTPTFGILVSSFAFAMIHPQGIGAWLPLATVGAVSATLAFQTGSLWPSVMMHAVHNSVLLTISLWR
ncbi:MAG: CPBP family intramembrane metalloprotease [Armatimonadetes bacterium]|nr:CPBP family intramembrane metalloprotease [Armatimonadota bacterium]